MRRKNDRAERRDAESAAVAALVDDIRALRLTLAADFSAAAAAIDAAEPAIARDIMAGDRGELRRLAAGFTAPAPARRRPVRRRAVVAAAAIPMVGVLAMTGAMALSTSRGASRAPMQRISSHHHIAAAARSLPETTTSRSLTTATAERPAATSQQARSTRSSATAASGGRTEPAPSPTPTGFAPAQKRPIKITGLLAVEHRLLGAWPTPGPATRNSLDPRSPIQTGLNDTVTSRTVLQSSS